jgi:hypothetical protein
MEKDRFKPRTPNPALPLAEGGGIDSSVVEPSTQPSYEILEAHLRAMERRRARLPTAYRRGFKEACEGTASPREAIKAKCYECVGYQNVKESIGGCTGYGCPLWAYRPYADGQDSE